MKVNFIRKPTKEDLLPKDDFIIEKEIVIEKELLKKFINHPLDYYDFIKTNKDLMYYENNVYHCIFVTSDDNDFGILVESEGYDYARYAAYLPKVLLE